MRGNEERGIVRMEVEGQDLPMVLDLQALAELEEELDLDNGMQDIAKILNDTNLSPRKMRAFFWAALNSADNGLGENLTTKDAAKLIQEKQNSDGYSKLVELMTELVVRSSAIPNVSEEDVEFNEEDSEDEEKNG